MEKNDTARTGFAGNTFLIVTQGRDLEPCQIVPELPEVEDAWGRLTVHSVEPYPLQGEQIEGAYQYSVWRVMFSDGDHAFLGILEPEAETM